MSELLPNPLNFMSFCYRERIHDNKEFNLGNTKPCCESKPVKSNSEQN